MFTYYDPENAPDESRPLMEESQKTLGMIPNLHRILAGAPAAYKAYLANYSIFTTETTLTPLEQQVVMMTSNFENKCHYCIPGHTWIMKSSKMPDDVIEALREGTELPDPKLQALSLYAKELLDTRGHIGDEKLKAFLDAGYTQSQALEVLVGLASKLISNFTNGLTHTKIDEPLRSLEWTHPSER